MLSLDCDFLRLTARPPESCFYLSYQTALTNDCGSLINGMTWRQCEFSSFTFIYQIFDQLTHGSAVISVSSITQISFSTGSSCPQLLNLRKRFWLTHGTDLFWQRILLVQRQVYVKSTNDFRLNYWSTLVWILNKWNETSDYLLSNF